MGRNYYLVISLFSVDLQGEDGCRGGQQGADAPDGEDGEQDLHSARLGGQRLHDRLQYQELCIYTASSGG